MNIQRPKNTKERGIIEFLVYKKGNTFIGVCLTFDIVEEGNNPTELMKSIREAAELHLETVIRNDLPDELLNRYAPEEYWKKYFATAKEIEKPTSVNTSSLIRSPYYRSLTAQMA
jgi:predicted RNase H-like HicB family nuclease